MNIFITKLDYGTQEADLKEAFEVFGEVSSVKIITDKFTGRSKGFGFVEMPDNEEAKSAISKLNESELDGRTIVVKKARPKEDNSRYKGRGNFNRNSY
ncbi:MAG: RNA-binding protein [Bacteroidales bacterium]|nr:RNA-binding protein [Bacteroidales bacterium]